MIWNLFKIAPRSFLGVDIGTFSIKIVELSFSGKKIKLKNYGEIKAEAFYQKPFRTFEKNTLTLYSQDVIQAVSAILQEAKIKEKKSCFSIPDFSSFFTSFSLPAMGEEELPQAVQYEARQHIPLPLSEVFLDWQIIEKVGSGEKPSSFKILLVAVPKEVINQYQEISKNSQLELRTLEAEVFGLSRCLTESHASSTNQPKEEQILILVDIGARSSTISVVSKDTIQLSHSLDIAGNDLTEAVSKALKVDYKEAEKLKKENGITENGRKEIKEAQIPLIDLILNEIKKISQDFTRSEKKAVQKVILAGGTALLPGLVDYFSENLKLKTEKINPFINIDYPQILEGTLKELSPSYAIATGAALRGLEL
ncbi:MAG: type IV pilus assembly protein PilM [Candidatus Nealsonbacteria bacterium]